MKVFSITLLFVCIANFSFSQGETCETAIEISSTGDVIMNNNIVWYTITPPSTGVYTLSTVAGGNIFFGEWTACAFPEVGASYDEITVELEANTDYTFKIEDESFNTVATWNFAEIATTPGEYCTNPITANEGTNSGSYDQWFKYTATVAATIDITGVDPSFFIFTYKNNCSSTFFGSFGNEVSVELGVGESLNIRIASSTETSYDWDIAVTPIAVGSTCISAEVITEGTAQTTESDYWYQFTAPKSAYFTVSSVSGNGTFNVFEKPENFCTGSFLADLFYLEQGDNIRININNISAPTAYEFSLQEFIPGPGDLCSNAISVTPGQYEVTSVPNWYSYTATDDESVTISSVGFSGPDPFEPDTDLIIYNSCGGGSIADNDDFDGSTYRSEVTLFVANSETIYFEWTDNYGDVPFTFELSTEEYVPEPGESCATAISITTPGQYEVTSLPFWYSYTATAEENVTISSVGFGAGLQDPDTDLIVYSSCGGSELDSSDDYGGTYQSEVALLLNIGETIYFQWTNAYADFPFTFELSVATCNLSTTASVTTEISCEGTSDGEITAVSSGGTGILEYSLDGSDWSNTSGIFTGLSAGTYTVLVRDEASCQEGSNSVELIDPTNPTWYQDADGDGFGDPNTSQIACSQPTGYVLDNTDCNDDALTGASVNPGATDTPGSGIDANCDGIFTWFEDNDDDGYGSTNTITSSNSVAGSGESALDTDCDDTNEALNPGESDVAGSGIDANCDGLYLWFVDADDDSFGSTTETAPSANSTPGTNEADNSDDCDDSDENLNILVTFYADEDGDGYGDPNTSQIVCSQPTGYVLDNTDCNDDISTGASVNPGATDTPGSGMDANCDGIFAWYQDLDEDGFGSTIVITSGNSSAGQGESALDTDCDDTDSERNPAASDTPGSGIDANCDGLYIWYVDADDDGFGSTTETSPVANSTPGAFEADNNEDCDDDDSNTVGSTLYYADSDGDGYGDPNNSQAACSQPTDYVLDNTDCNDSVFGINPGQTDLAGSGIDANCDGVYTWFEDSDDDGYGSSVQITSSNSSAGQGESTENTDCDDSDSSINPGATDVPGSRIDANCDGLYTWYLDNDQDTYGSDILTSSAFDAPAPGEATNNLDCDDNTPNSNTNELKFSLYLDSDGDGYGDSNTLILSCVLVSGYVNNNQDCDDSDPQTYPGATEIIGDGKDQNCDSYEIWYIDQDQDGYGNAAGNTIAVYILDGGDGGSLSSNTLDCDDLDRTINPETIWYIDEDGDGYPNIGISETSCEPLDGYILSVGLPLGHADCDDSDPAVNIFGTDEIGTGIDGNCDGLYLWYVDLDEDGVGSSSADLSSNSSPLVGQSAVSGDCNDSNPDVIEETIWYRDGDADGYGDLQFSIMNCEQLLGYVSNSDDCDDADAKIYPGAPASPDGKDNNCDGTIDKLDQTITLDPIADFTYGNQSTVVLLGSSSSTLALNWTIESGPATFVANVANEITITGAGTIEISAIQPGNESYNPSATSTLIFTVNPAELAVTANDYRRVYGEENPSFTYFITGYVASENEVDLATSPTVTTEATASSDVGSYPLIASGGASDNYTFTYINGALEITPATASISVSDNVVDYDGTEKAPTITTDPEGLNYNLSFDGTPIEPGNYIFTVTIDELNYVGESSGILTINPDEVLSVEQILTDKLDIYPNPTTEEVTISWERENNRTIMLYNLQGVELIKEKSHGIKTTLNLRRYPIGTYRIIIKEGDKTYMRNVTKTQ